MAQIDPQLYNIQQAPPARMVASSQRPVAAQVPMSQLPAHSPQVPPPRQKTTPPDDKMITVNYKEFMQAQNQFAHNLGVYHSMATNQMYAASQHVSAIAAAMVQVQNNIKATLSHNNITVDDIDFGSYTALNDLLNKDHELISNPLAGFGAQRGVTVPPMLAGQAPKKQRKARKPKDPSAPKRPITAFFLFSRDSRDEVRKQVQQEMGTADVKPGDVQKAIQDRWNAMSETQQQIWKNKYNENMKGYRQAVDDWRKSGGQGPAPTVPGAEGDDAVEAEEEEEILLPDVDGEGDEDEDEDDDDEIAADDDDEDEDEEEEEEEEIKEPTPPPAKKKTKKAAAPVAAPIPEPLPAKKKKVKAEAITPVVETTNTGRKRKNGSPAVESGKPKKKKAAAAKQARDTGIYGDEY